MEKNKIYNEDCLAGLKKIDDNSVDCCVTSPPYFGLRDYGHKGQIGLEETPELYIEKMVEVFTEVKRVLKKEGTLWLNIGDSYAANRGYQVASTIGANKGEAQKGSGRGMKAKDYSLKPKDLIGIPWMAAFALRGSGWYLRSEIIWAKAISGEINIGTTMPESVQDRPTKSHETIFLLSKSNKYYYDIDAIRQDLLFNRYSLSNKMGSSGKEIKGAAPGQNPQGFVRNGHSGYYDGAGNPLFNEAGKNKRSVWYNVPANYVDAHFATFPEELIVDCIKAGCPENGIVLDPFIGAGTTGLVARKLNRNYIGFELNSEYIKIANKRLQDELGFFI